MKVRSAAETDFSRVMELYRQLQPSDVVLTNGKDLAIYKEILADKRLHLFLLEDHGEIKSTCYLNVIPNITRAARPYGIIENVVTDKDARGFGFGKRIIDHALETAWAGGCYKVMLQTGSSRESTHAFYRACGLSGDDKQAYVAWCPGWRMS